MKISAVYITKNEESNIKKSIESCKKVVDEIIIVDTGSTDATIEICSQLGCQVYNFEWVYDFAKARNYAISLCKGDIILFLDADEYFAKELTYEDRELIESAFLDKEQCDGIAFMEVDIDKNTGIEHHTSCPCKVFRNIPQISFVGKIHESLKKSGEPLKIAIASEISLIHTGYSSDISLSKVERNLEILNKLETKRTLDYYYLARENFFCGNYEEAKNNIDIFFQQKDNKEIMHNTNIGYLAYFYKQDILRHLSNSGDFVNDEKILMEVKKEFPYIPEVYFRLGILYLQKDLKTSLMYFKKCIAINESFNKEHYELNNFLSFQPKIYFYMSKIHQILGNRNEAIQKSIVSCMLDKKDRDNLGQLLYLLNRKKVQENIRLIKNIYHPKKKEDYEFIIRCLANTNLIPEFIEFCRQYNIVLKGSDDNVYYAVMLTGEYKTALESLKNFNNNKSNFIMSVILLYSNSIELFNEYAPYLDSIHFKVVKALIEGNYSGIDEHLQLLINILCKLLNYGIVDFPEFLKQFIIDNANTADIGKLVAICNNNSMYEISIDILTRILMDKRIANCDEIISEYLFSLYCKGDYAAFIDYYFCLLSKLERKDIQINLLRVVKEKKLDKKLRHKATELLKEINNA